MPKEESPKLEEKDEKELEDEKEEEKEDEDDVFSGAFSDATKAKKDDSEDKTGDDDKKSQEKADKSGEDKGGKKDDDKDTKKEESAKEKEGGDKGAKEEESKTKQEIDKRAKKLEEIMGKAQETEDKGGDEKPPPKKAKPKKEVQEEETGETEELDPKKLLEKVKFTESEKDLIGDIGEELISVTQKIIKQTAKELGGSAGTGGDSQEVIQRLDQQDEQIKTLQTELVIARMIPDYQEIVYDGDRVDENGDRVLNPEFWDWVDKQDEAIQRLAYVDNPMDNVAILKFYKEERAKKTLKDKQDKDRDKLDKQKKLHSSTPNTGKVTKSKGAERDEDDFSGAFAEASKKAEKGLI